MVSITQISTLFHLECLLLKQFKAIYLPKDSVDRFILDLTKVNWKVRNYFIQLIDFMFSYHLHERMDRVWTNGNAKTRTRYRSRTRTHTNINSPLLDRVYRRKPVTFWIFNLINGSPVRFLSWENSGFEVFPWLQSTHSTDRFVYLFFGETKNQRVVLNYKNI